MTINIEVDSPFSSTKTNLVWGRRDNQTIYQCRETGVLFFDRNILNDHDYNEYYPYLKNWDEVRFEYELNLRKNSYTKQLEDIKKYTTKLNLLDTGAGPGYLCKVAQNLGWNADGIEISKEAKKYGIKHFNVNYIDYENIKSNYYNVIICHHVLEHIKNPIDFIRKIHDSLAENGLLVIHVPHQQPLTFKIRNWLFNNLYDSKETFCTLYSNIHISGFTPNSLRSFIEKQKFKTIFIKSCGMWSKYYDPFFFEDMLRSNNYSMIIKRTLRHSVENIGNLFELGDWIVGYFSKR